MSLPHYRGIRRRDTIRHVAIAIGLLAITGRLCAADAQHTPSEASINTAVEPPILGFNRAGVAQERTLEKQFDSQLKRQNLSDWMKRMSARPHHVGSAFDKENAEFIAAQFRDWG